MSKTNGSQQQGIRIRHRRTCNSKGGGACNCKPGYEAWVYSPKDGKKIRRTFDSPSAAKGWRRDAASDVSRGKMRAPTRITLREGWEEWYEGAKAGTILNRSGQPYKPASLRHYEKEMRLRVLDDYGNVRLSAFTKQDLQKLVNKLVAAGLAASTVQTALLPVRAVFKRAIGDGDKGVVVDPCAGLEMPSIQSGERSIATPSQAHALVEALPRIADKALWATAFYAGLRRNELQALRWRDVDLAGGVIKVRKGWDPIEGEIEPKSKKGKRRVPIVPGLRDLIIALKLDSGRDGDDFVFGKTATEVFDPRAVQDRADTAWEKAGLDRITLHGCRHTCASLMIDAGVNVKALSDLMGHANIGITLDLYGHLMPGAEAEIAALMGSYLAAKRQAAEDAARSAETSSEADKGVGV
jgi:integrase